MTTDPRANPDRRATQARNASRLILVLGVVSLFADATYESARSILGPYLSSLGASGEKVAMIAGLGELIGYGLRFGSGYLADRTGRYWGLALIGFTLNMAAVPLLALTGRWEGVAMLIALERTGKAIRNPPRDAILARAAEHVGRGWGFGLQEALGQIGAVAGPLAISAALSYDVAYRTCLGFLAIPALLTVLLLAMASQAYPTPRVSKKRDEPSDRRLPRSYWMCLTAAALFAVGGLDFPLVAFHAREKGILPAAWIPALYAVAMGSQALSSLGFGMMFDRVGRRALLAIAPLTLPIAPLAFGGHAAGLFLSMSLWGLGMGAQKAMFKATIAEMAPSGRRGFAFGCFDLCYGLSWFMGSLLIGFCYERSMTALISVAVGSQILAVPAVMVVAWRAPATHR